jgi:hypothetical protein
VKVYFTDTVYRERFSTTAFALIYRQQVSVRKGDYLVIRSSSQFSEKQLQSSRLSSAIFINDVRQPPHAWQYVQRSANHHMPLGAIARHTAKATGTLLVEHRVKPSRSAL